MPASDYTLYHNPSCGTSRNVLALLREAGIEPRIVLYRDELLDVPALRALCEVLGQPARALLRSKEALCAQLGLDRNDVSDEVILSAIVAHPELFNRPVVVSPRGARVCRPSEEVRALLP
ncbi:MAG TPA: arsenate reductase (glutaredoxin) [Chiayiivirga sp.]|nr:arsenate reductase (glutaredoxin) [Chiayiivirga sp.]